ncbi:MAG: RipA family octameric membrane protein [Culicoidibacterales bacterium]
MNEQEILLAQWQTGVEMANEVSNRRDTMNNLFVTLNLTLVATITVIWDIKSAVLSIAGIALCVVWIFFIGNFKELNTAKFAVINKIEEQLPAQVFAEEWQYLKGNKKYIEGTKLEKSLPIMFLVIYTATLILNGTSFIIATK